MSFTRIVKGNIVKITHGNHRIFAGGNIEYHSKKEIITNAEKGIKYSNNPLDPPVIEMEINNEFKGKVIFKLINPLPNFVAKNYNKLSKTFIETNKSFLPYGFDWYRKDWEDIVNATQEYVNIEISNLTKNLLPNQEKENLTNKLKYDITTTNHIKTTYKLCHILIENTEKLYEYSIWQKLKGIAEISNKDEILDDPNNTLTPIIGQDIHQIEELDLITGQNKGIIYKSNDSDLTNFNKIKNSLGGRFDSLKTFKLISSLKEMKKEYVPVFKYFSTEQGSLKIGLNLINENLKINNENYIVPWYSCFYKEENEIIIDIILEHNNSVKGKIKIVALEEDSSKISISGDVETNIINTESIINKKVKIKFNKPIDNHTSIEARFYDESKIDNKNYKGDIVGLLNIYKNNIEYKLNVQYINVVFKGEIDNIPCYMNLEEKLTKINTLINFNNKTVQLTNPLIPKPSLENGIVKLNKSDILNSTTLETYVKSNVNLFINTLKQSLIKPDINKTNKILEINFEKDNSKKITDSNLTGIDLIKNSIIEYNEYNDFTLKVNSDNFINGLIQEYEKKHGTEEKGILIFFIPFTIIEPSGSDYNDIKGRVDKVEYDSKYLILARSLLEYNSKEVPAHEVGHSLGLHHTFVDFNTNSNKHHFIQNETLNVMDYPLDSNSPPIDFGIYLYKYQWDIMLGDIKTTTQRGDLIKINSENGEEFF